MLIFISAEGDWTPLESCASPTARDSIMSPPFNVAQICHRPTLSISRKLLMRCYDLAGASVAIFEIAGTTYINQSLQASCSCAPLQTFLPRCRSSATSTALPPCFVGDSQAPGRRDAGYALFADIDDLYLLKRYRVPYPNPIVVVTLFHNYSATHL